MAREIKFRAWLIHAKELCQVTAIEFRSSSRYVHLAQNGAKDYVALLDHEVILEQFTGLLDKNGKEIYEGDIVHLLPSKWPAFGEGPKEFLGLAYGIVKWPDEYFLEWSLTEFVRPPHPYAGRTIYSSLHTYTPGRLEVIGNIHQNPELLEAPCSTPENR